MVIITRMATTITTNMNKLSPAAISFASDRILDLPKRHQQKSSRDGDGSPESKKPIKMLPCTPTHVPAMVDVYMSAFGEGAFAHWWPKDREVMRPWSEERFLNRFKDGRSVQFLGVEDGGGGGGGRGRTGEEFKLEEAVAYAKWTLPKPGQGVDCNGEDCYTKLRRAFGLAVGGKGEVVINGDASTLRNGEEDGKTAKEQHHGDHPPALPEGVNEEWYHEFFDGVGFLGEKYGTDKMLELSLMCTRPSVHGQGIAGAMIRCVLEEVVDPLGIRTVLLGLALAAPLYRRLGFVTVEEITFEKAREEAGEKSALHVMIREPRGVAPNGI